LDEVVYKIYGDLSLFEELLELNTKLSNKIHLEENDIVYLVDVKPILKTYSQENLQALW